MISGRFGSPPWTNASELVSTSRRGRQLGDDGPRLWPGARVPYEFSNTIDFREWQIMQHVFSNISSVTNIQFVPRSVKIVIEIIAKYCSWISIQNTISFDEETVDDLDDRQCLSLFRVELLHSTASTIVSHLFFYF